MKNKEIQVKQNVNCLQRRKKEMFSSLFLLLCHLRAVGLNEHISRLKYYLHFFLFFYRVNERRNNLVYILKLFFFFVQCPTFYYEKKTENGNSYTRLNNKNLLKVLYFILFRVRGERGEREVVSFLIRSFVHFFWWKGGGRKKLGWESIAFYSTPTYRSSSGVKITAQGELDWMSSSERTTFSIVLLQFFLPWELLRFLSLSLFRAPVPFCFSSTWDRLSRQFPSASE